MEYLYTYWDFLQFDPNFQNDFLGLLLQTVTICIASVALWQVVLLKQQNKYIVHTRKIEALNRFKDILVEGDNLSKLFKDKVGFEIPKIELHRYTVSELNKKEDIENFQKLEKIMSNDWELNEASHHLANSLDLFSMILEDRDIYESIKHMIAQAFCETIEKNSTAYVYNRNDEGKRAHMRFQSTIDFKLKLITLVGSIADRKEIQAKNIEKYQRIIKENSFSV